MSDNNSRIRIALFGAAPDTANMGVSALFMSAVSGVSQYVENVEFVVFDYGNGRRDRSIYIPGMKEIPLILYGARLGYRYYRPENLTSMALLAQLGVLGGSLNEGIRLIDSCAAVLDVSGGDSFSDIYGKKRFYGIYTRKLISVRRGVPLVLLPQTYGPFKSELIRKKSSEVVRQSEMAWARDVDSFKVLKQLVGDGFDPKRHRCGVDMAFGLLPKTAETKLDAKLNSWINVVGAPNIVPRIGFNVSGLIYNDPVGAINKYGFKADYKQVVIGFLKFLLENTEARIVLISHVMDKPGHFESDLGACLDVASQFEGNYSDRIMVAPATLDQSEVKWLISKMSWFCGTRMHSTIASLSSGVPTASVSYSDKTKGVFETCGQGQQVFDPRQLDVEQVISGLIQSYEARESIQTSLQQHLPYVMNTVSSQMQSIASLILASREYLPNS